jgi:hypothetical protein
LTPLKKFEGAKAPDAFVAQELQAITPLALSWHAFVKALLFPYFVHTECPEMLQALLPAACSLEPGGQDACERPPGFTVMPECA